MSLNLQCAICNLESPTYTPCTSAQTPFAGVSGTTPASSILTIISTKPSPPPRAGIQNWEHLDLPSDEIARRLGDALKTHGLEARSLYVNARLHEENWRDGAGIFLK